jgi:hypothetical protein
MFQGRAVPGYALLGLGLALLFHGGGATVVGLMLVLGGGYLLVRAYREGW